MTSITALTGDGVHHAILEAAQRLLADEGLSGLTVRRVAQEAGVSTMNVYSRFGGKEGLVDALFIEGFRRLEAQILAAPTTADPVDDLRRCNLGYRTFALANPTYYAVMFKRAGQAPPSRAAVDAACTTLDLLAARVQRAMDAGRIDADRVDPGSRPSEQALHLAASLWATSHGLVSLELDGIGPKDIDWPARYEQTYEVLLRGLRSDDRQPAAVDRRE